MKMNPSNNIGSTESSAALTKFGSRHPTPEMMLRTGTALERRSTTVKKGGQENLVQTFGLAIKEEILQHAAATTRVGNGRQSLEIRRGASSFGSKLMIRCHSAAQPECHDKLRHRCGRVETTRVP